jgi:5-methylcytosine-specific restriction endonuclease McrA
MDTNSVTPFGQNDPFGEDFFLPPHPEELRVWAKNAHQDNQDAIHLYVDLLVWGMLDNPDQLKLLIALLYLWEEVETEWLAEAGSMSVRDTCEVAEAESPVAFNCVDCKRELPILDRQHQIERLRSHKTYHRGETQGIPRELLCARCIKRRGKDEERQRELDQRRYRAIIRDHRKGSYGARRMKKEWEMLKKEVHSRDGYRCRMCNRDDLPLHVHHRTYNKYAEEPLEDLITLCADCHGVFHSYSKVS